MFSGLAYLATETELAGRKISATKVRIKIMMARPSKVLNIGNKRNSGITEIKLQVCTLKCPNVSVSHPPNQEPQTEPNPKQPNTKPICVLLNPNSEDI